MAMNIFFLAHASAFNSHDVGIRDIAVATGFLIRKRETVFTGLRDAAFHFRAVAKFDFYSCLFFV